MLEESGNGFVGLNPGKAAADIRKINNDITGMQRMLVTATDGFFYSLSNTWYSPKAVEFAKMALPLINDIDDEIISFNESTINKCVSAFNALARSHGSACISIGPGPYMGVTYAPLKDIGPDGTVGMMADKVEASLDDYLRDLKNVSSALGSVQSSVAFYDTDGSLVGACKTNIEKLRSLIEEAVTSISSNVSSSIETEVKLVEKAAATAAAALQD